MRVSSASKVRRICQLISESLVRCLLLAPFYEVDVTAVGVVYALFWCAAALLHPQPFPHYRYRRRAVNRAGISVDDTAVRGSHVSFSPWAAEGTLRCDALGLPNLFIARVDTTLRIFWKRKSIFDARAATRNLAGPAEAAVCFRGANGEDNPD